MCIRDSYPDNASFKAVCRFYEHYCGAETPLPEEAHTERILASDWMTFQLQGDTELLATQDDAHDYAAQAYNTEENLGRCLITGEEKPLAVSYTHLDVYKRQALDRSSPFCSCALWFAASVATRRPPARV